MPVHHIKEVLSFDMKNDEYKIMGISNELTNFVLNQYFCSFIVDERERNQYKRMLELCNRYGIASSKVPEFIKELNNISSEKE